MFSTDSSHVYHVAKSGSDANAGLAQQYPIALAADAFLTIGAAVTAATSGDTICIWPGAYAESVDLATAAKSLELQGMGNRNECKIIPATGDAVTVHDDCVLRNLWIEASEAASVQGVVVNSKDNLLIEDCYVHGTADGLYTLNAPKRMIARNSIFSSTYDGAALGYMENFICDNCIFITDGTYGATTETHALTATNGWGVFNNCTFEGTKTGATTGKSYCIRAAGSMWTFNNCVLRGSTDASDAAGIVYGVGTTSAARVSLNNCTIRCTETGASSVLELSAGAGTILTVNGCSYDPTLTTGTIVSNLHTGNVNVASGVVESNMEQIGGLDCTSGNVATLNLKQLDISNSAGNAISAVSTGGDGHGLYAAGNGTGHGLYSVGGATSGSGAYLAGGGTGSGLYSFGGTENGKGIFAIGQGSGSGINASCSVGTGHGFYAKGGSTSGNGIYADAGTGGHGLYAAGNGVGHGLYAYGGATNGNGIYAVAQGSGSGLYAYGGTGTGSGIFCKAGTTGNNHGLYATGQGDGNGIYAVGSGSGSGLNALSGTTGNGIKAWCGSGSGSGIAATGGSTDGNGMTLTGGADNGIGLSVAGVGSGNGLKIASVSATSMYVHGGGNAAWFRSTGGGGRGIYASGNGAGSGIQATGGASDGNGMTLTGGATNSHGLSCVKAGTGSDIDGDIAGTVSSAAVADIADGVWDEVLTVGSHNVGYSAGQRLRYLILTGAAAQAGTANKIQLAATESSTDYIFNGNIISLVGGTGAGQTRLIVEYEGTTNWATVDRDWETQPIAGTIYEILPFSSILLADHGQATAGAAGSITLAATASTVNDAYVGSQIFISSGTGNGQMRLITDYTGSSKLALVSPNWTTTPDNTSVYKVIPVGRTILDSLGTDALAAINTEVDTALSDINLDHLALTGDATLTNIVADNTIFAHLMAISGDISDYDNDSHSLEKLSSLCDSATSGAGAITFTYTLTDGDSGLPIADADVWATSDAAGANVLASGRTNSSGVVTFYLDAGVTYIWRQKSGYNFTNPDSETVA